MTKGEYLESIGVSMIRRDLDEEADEGFKKAMSAVIECFRNDQKSKAREEKRRKERWM